MPREGYASITVKDETLRNLERLATQKKTSVPKVIDLLLNQMKGASD